MPAHDFSLTYRYIRHSLHQLREQGSNKVLAITWHKRSPQLFLLFPCLLQTHTHLFCSLSNKMTWLVYWILILSPVLAFSRALLNAVLRSTSLRTCARTWGVWHTCRRISNLFLASLMCSWMSNNWLLLKATFSWSLATCCSLVWMNFVNTVLAISASFASASNWVQFSDIIWSDLWWLTTRSAMVPASP